MKKTLPLCVLLLVLGVIINGHIDTAPAAASSTITFQPPASAGTDQTAVASPTPSRQSRVVVAIDQPAPGTVAFRVIDSANGASVKDLPPVADVNGTDYPELSFDAAYVYFTTGTAADGPHNIARQVVATGVVQMVAINAQQPAVDPTGQYLAFGRDGQLTVRNLTTQHEQKLSDTDVSDNVKTEVLAGVRSIVWPSEHRLAALVSSDFHTFHVVAFDVDKGVLGNSTLRDAPKGQVLGAGTSSSEVSVVDDMASGLLVETVVLTGPAAVQQRARTADRLTVWDVSPDGQHLLVSTGSELRRQAIDSASSSVLAAASGTAGY